MKKKPAIEDLLKRIKELEAGHFCCSHYKVCPYTSYPPQPIVITPPQNTGPQPHYHGAGTPCYANPCVWC